MNQKLHLRYFVAIIALFYFSTAMAQEKAHWELVDVEVQTPPTKYESRGTMSPDNNVEVTYRLSRSSINIQKKVVDRYLSNYKDDPVKQKNWTLAHDHKGETATGQFIISGLPENIYADKEVVLRVSYSGNTSCPHGDLFGITAQVTVIDGLDKASVRGGSKVLKTGKQEKTGNISVEDNSYVTLRKSGDFGEWNVPFNIPGARMDGDQIYRYIGVALSRSYGVAQPETPIVYFKYKFIKGEKAESNDNPTDEDDTPEDIPPYEEDNDASDEEGIWKYIIPPFVGGCLVGWWRKRRKNKKKQNDDDPEPEPEEEEKEEEEDDEPDQLQMQVYKNFGDTLLVGDKGQQVNALIVRKPKKGPEYVDEKLTRQIQIMSGDEYLHVEMGDIENGWKTAYVWAPEAENPPLEGIVKFVLANEGASYTNRLHFKIETLEVVFDPEQTNLTIPARHEKAEELPFALRGIDDQDVEEITVTITDQNGNVTSDYGATIEPCNKKANLPYHVIIKDLLLDEKKDQGIPGKYANYIIKIDARSKDGLKAHGEMPLFRFYMGLVLELSGEVGCYIEEYDPMKHEFNSWFRWEDKQYVRAQTHCRVRLYDYDERSRKLLVTDVPPEEVIFNVEPIKEDAKAQSGESVKNILDNIGLTLFGKPTPTGDGYNYIMYCKNGIITAPNRFNARASVKYGKKEFERNIYLTSQPRRTSSEMEAGITKDRGLEERLKYLDEQITRTGTTMEFQSLTVAIQLMLRYYTEEYGLDERTVNGIIGEYSKYLRKRQITYNRLQAESYAEMKDAEREAGFWDWVENRKKAFDEMGFVAQLALGFLTFGAAEILTTSVSIMGSMKEYADKAEGELTWSGVFLVGAKEATLNYLQDRGMAAIGSVASQVGKKFISVRAGGKSIGDSFSEAWKFGKERFTLKNISSQLKDGIKAEVNTVKKFKSVISAKKDIQKASEEAATFAKELVSDAKYRISTGEKKPKYRRALEYGENCATQKVEDLRAAVELSLMNPTPENIQLKNKLVMEVQSDKLAMFKLNQVGEEFVPTRAVFNETITGVSNSVDDAVMRRLSEISGIPKDRIFPMNASSKQKLDLQMGKKVTFDRDITYYYKNAKGEWVYFDQKGTEALYNSELRRFLKEPDLNATKKYDHTVIEDILGHKESYGKDLKKMIDPEFRRLPLDDPKKVSDAIVFKAKERFDTCRELLKQAENAANDTEMLKMQSKALSEMIEGCRQEVKTFDLLVSRQAARIDILGESKISGRLHAAVEVLRRMTENQTPFERIEVALETIGYSVDSLAEDIGKLAISIG